MYSVRISLSHYSKERAVVYSDWTGWDNMPIIATMYREHNIIKAEFHEWERGGSSSKEGLTAWM